MYGFTKNVVGMICLQSLFKGITRMSLQNDNNKMTRSEFLKGQFQNV